MVRIRGVTQIQNVLSHGLSLHRTSVETEDRDTVCRGNTVLRCFSGLVDECSLLPFFVTLLFVFNYKVFNMVMFDNWQKIQRKVLQEHEYFVFREMCIRKEKIRFSPNMIYIRQCRTKKKVYHITPVI